MGQRDQWHERAPSPPARMRVGATVEPFLIRTPEEAAHVWPLAEAILPADTIEQLTPKDQHVLLAAFRRNSALAYRCLRWARWMAPNRKLEVICLKCQSMTAWSHTAASQKLRDGTSRIDGGKWRWVCPKKRLDPKGCGGRFFDTTETPFCHARVRPGVVFAALAYSSGVIQRLLQKNRQTLELCELQTVLDGVEAMSDQTLHRRLTQYARLFCGTVLLRDCQKLTRSFDGVQALEARLQLLHGTGPVAKKYDAAAIRERQESYGQLGKLVESIQRIDKDSPRGQASQRLDRRKELWEDLQDVVQTLREPIHPSPLNLPALLAEASFPLPKRTR